MQFRFQKVYRGIYDVLTIEVSDEEIFEVMNKINPLKLQVWGWYAAIF